MEDLLFDIVEPLITDTIGQMFDCYGGNGSSALVEQTCIKDI